MRYQAINNHLFINNRKALCEKMASGTVALIYSADPLRTSGDGLKPYQQDSNFFYLTGIDQEESAIILYKEGETCATQLFIRKTDERLKIWEGEKLNLEQAAEISGIDDIQWNDSLDSTVNRLMEQSKNVLMDFDIEISRFPESRNHRMSRELAAKFKNANIKDIKPIIRDLRMTKSEAEISLIQQAGQITRCGYEDVIASIKPGMKEFELEAEFARVFISKGSRGFAYNPIIASGAGACILHYEHNSQVCKDGDLILMDVGAEYAHYNADVTRTVPVNGRYSSRQKGVYQAVLDIKNKATDLLKPGKTLKEVNLEVGRLMEEHLVDLGLLRIDDLKTQDPEKPLYKKFYMHSTFHHLGLDVHDLSDREEVLAPGMVLTVEPGIYIGKESLGIRLEDDILIGEQENINLTPGIPIEIDEIEEIMNN